LQRLLVAVQPRCDPAAMTDAGNPQTYAVLVFDMGRTGAADGERLIPGFPDLATAAAYAEARTRASVEELRKPGISPAELRSLWHIYGEDCSVLGGGFRASDRLSDYIANPATPDQCDWAGLLPKSPAP
jgi:hypothetical protein